MKKFYLSIFLLATFSTNCATKRKKTLTSDVALQLLDGEQDYVLK